MENLRNQDKNLENYKAAFYGKFQRMSATFSLHKSAKNTLKMCQAKIVHNFENEWNFNETYFYIFRQSPYYY